MGTIRAITLPMLRMSTGMATARIHVSCTSSCRAKIVPPMAVMGAAMSRVHVIWTSVCTWVTSFVTRVMRLGAPKWATSLAEKSVTWWNMRGADVAAEPRRDPRAVVDRGDEKADLEGADHEHQARRASRCTPCRR